MSESTPLLTLCMATCLRADLFPESLQGLLRQTYSPLEIIVLVDGANPESLDALRCCGDPRVRWITTDKPSGMVPAWNRVCREAKGKYVLFCADDDVLTERAVDEQVELMERNPSVVLCHADFTFIDDEDKELSRSISPYGRFIRRGVDAWARYIVATSCCMQTTVMRKDAWERVNGWDEDAGNPGDNSLYLKLLRLGDEGHVTRVACHYRIRTRRPDSWEKSFRNLCEFATLSRKHLSSIPAGLQISRRTLEARLSRRLARSALALLPTAPNPAKRAEVVAWLAESAWPHSMYGRAAQWLEKAGLAESVLLRSERAQERVRAKVKEAYLFSRRITDLRRAPT